MKFTSLINKNKEYYKQNNFIARVLGIFNEEIIDIWCNRENSTYKNLGRPTLYTGNNTRGHTLDFTFCDKNTGRNYIAEMKCWIAYNNYKFLEFTETTNLSSLIRESKAFETFIDYTDKEQRNAITVKIWKERERKPIKCDGSILIWPSYKREDKQSIKDKYNFHDIISLESVISELINEKNQSYIDLLEKKKNWFDYFISRIRDNVF